MSNRKKLGGARDGATRITPDKSTTGAFCGLYKLEAYDKKADEWNTLEGYSNLTWGASSHSQYQLHRVTEGVQGSQQERITNSGTE